MKAYLLLCTALLGIPSLPAAAVIEPDAATIVRRSVEANERNYKALPHFNYFKTERAADGRTWTYEDLMIFGSRYSRLVAMNGEPLPPERQREEQKKLDDVTRMRSIESADDRAKRVANYERERERDQFLLNEMASAFVFTLAGEQQLAGHDVYVLKARPRPGYRPSGNRAKVLTGMEGTLWIEKNSFQWVRVEAEVIRPISIEGFLARVQPGTRFRLDQAPGAGDLWFPTRFTMHARAKILFLFSKTDDQDETYFRYAPVPSHSD